MQKSSILILTFLLLLTGQVVAQQEKSLDGRPVIEPPSWSVRAHAMLGDPKAQMDMGMAYAVGAGVDRSMIEARQWWEKAAANGNVAAQYALGLLFVGTGYDGVSQDYTVAAKWFQKASEKNYIWAQYTLGVMHERGWGVAKSDKLAGQWFLRAAEQGNEYAHFNVGLMFFEGQGTTRDPLEAAKWFRKAAQQGNPRAAYFMGQMFENGDGVSVDMDLAVTYYKRAADGGVAAAQTRLADFYYEGTAGLPQKYEEALRLYRKAAEQNDGTAAILLARMYDAGIGTAKDPVEAQKWSRVGLKSAIGKQINYKMELEDFGHFLNRHKVEEVMEKNNQAMAEEKKREKNERD